MSQNDRRWKIKRKKNDYQTNDNKWKKTHSNAKSVKINFK